MAWGIVAAGNRQIAAEDKRVENERKVAARLIAERQAVVRALIYAQIRRAKLTALGHSAFIGDPENGVLYIAIYRSLFPTIEALERIELLSVEEVRAVTSFFYFYQEEIGFLTGSSEEFIGRRDGVHPPVHFELKRDVVAYPLADERFRGRGKGRLGLIAVKAEKAITAVRDYCNQDHSGHSTALLTIITEDDQKSITGVGRPPGVPVPAAPIEHQPPPA